MCNNTPLSRWGGVELSGLWHGDVTHFFSVRVSKQLPNGELTRSANNANVFLAGIQKKFMWNWYRLKFDSVPESWGLIQRVSYGYIVQRSLLVILLRNALSLSPLPPPALGTSVSSIRGGPEHGNSTLIWVDTLVTSHQVLCTAHSQLAAATRDKSWCAPYCVLLLFPFRYFLLYLHFLYIKHVNLKKRFLYYTTPQ